MTTKEKKNQNKLEAKFRARQIKQKYESMQAKTGNVRLNTSYSRIQKQIMDSVNTYGHAVDVNKGQYFQEDDHLEAA